MREDPNQNLPVMQLQSEVALRLLAQIPAETKSAPEKDARKAALAYLKEFLDLRPGK